MFNFLGENKAPKRKGRHFLALLGYIHGFKIGQEIALQYQSYLVSPVIILPSTNQQQSVNIQQSAADENYQENSGTIQSIKPAKLISKPVNKENDIEIIYAPKRKVLQTDINKYNEELINVSVRQNEILNETGTSPVGKNGTKTDEVQAATNVNSTEVEKISETTTKPNGPYTLSTYNNEAVNSLSLTKVLDEDQQLPPVIDKRWQNFKANLSNLILDDNATANIEQNNTDLNFTTTSTDVITESPKETVTYANGPYPNRWYNNGKIDQLSITTNYYTNEDLRDGWGSSVNEITRPNSSGFKPLAGLYYDGFLHRPLKKFGFISPNYSNQYPYNE